MTQEKTRSTPRTSKPSPELLVIGRDPEATGDVDRALGPLPVRRRVVRDSSVGIARAWDPQTVGAVLVPPLPDATAERTLAALRERESERALPLFVVVPLGLRGAQVRRLYRAGAMAVFEWPREAHLIADAISEMLGLAIRANPRDEDRALARAVQARLRLRSDVAAGVRVRVRGGRIALSNDVDSLWRKRRIEDEVARTPGVNAVDTSSFGVRDAGLPDREIARHVRALLRGAASVEAGTITATVSHGHVVLMGTATSGAERTRVEELVENVRGVRSIDNLLEVAAGRKSRDRALSRELADVLRERYPRSEIHVAVLGGVAVLTGRTDLLATKRGAEKLALRYEPISRVVNKLEVRRAAAPKAGSPTV